MYLFDDVIRPLNNWALYKKKATVREKCLAQELNTMVSTKVQSLNFLSGVLWFCLYGQVTE